MKRILLITFLIFNSILIFSQNNETINEFIFNSDNRGGGKTIIIHADSVFFITMIRTPSKSTTKSKAKIQRSDWDKLVNSVSEYKLADLVNLPSPTNRRAGDGAAFSNIYIATAKTKYDSGEFDDYNPNEKLVKLMKVIQEIENTYNKQ